MGALDLTESNFEVLFDSIHSKSLIINFFYHFFLLMCPIIFIKTILDS